MTRKQITVSNNKLRFIDFFCGAGGFSEGLRLAGLAPVLGIDNWPPALSTYTRNQSTKVLKVDIEKISKNFEFVESLPNVELIVGSPPCVSFSNSNRSGYADKSKGICLTEAFFRIVAIKKHQKGTLCKGWLMENVPKALPFLPNHYTFADLDIADWARTNGIDPKSWAIDLRGKSHILDSSDLGAPQKRKRLFLIEINGQGIEIDGDAQEERKTLGQILDSLPNNNAKSKKGDVVDPNYSGLKISRENLTDHFYDTGIAYRYWKESQYLKTNHPYMGKMSFPERLDAPARTVVASPFVRSRESMIFRCGSGRVGDGQYRAPTVREAAVLMTFPITYQFFGSEGQKWKLVGNAVCPLTAKYIGDQVRKIAGLRIRRSYRFSDVDISADFTNLNSYKKKRFEARAPRKAGAKFRRHMFKYGNMTIALANYNMNTPTASIDQWGVFATYGISVGHKIDPLSLEITFELRRIAESELGASGRQLLCRIERRIKETLPNCPEILQDRYERGMDFHDSENPVTLLENLKEDIENCVNGSLANVANLRQFRKDEIPLKQIVSAFSLLTVVNHLREQKLGPR